MAMEVFKLVGRITYEGQQKVEAGLNRLGQKIEAAEEKLAKFGEAAQAVGDKTKAIGEGITQKVGAPLLAIGGLGIAAANDLDKAFDRIAAQTDRTAQDTMELQGAARDLWRAGYGENAAAAAEAVALVDRNLGNLVENTAQVKELTEQAMILQDAFGYDIQESTRAAAALMQNFGISGTEAMDMITTAAQRGGDYSGELLDSISEYSTQFANMGYSASNMMGMFVEGAQNGIFSLDKLADAVKESFLQITDGADNTKAAVEELGLNYGQITGDISAGGEKANAAFGVIMTAIAGVTDEADRNRLAVELMGTPIEDLGPQYQAFFADTKRELQNFTGSTAQAGEELQDNFGHKLTETVRTLQSSLEPLGGVIIDVISPAIDKVAAGAEKAKTWFQGLSDGTQNLIVYLGLAGIAIGPLLMVIGALITSVGAISGAIAGIGLVTAGWIAGIALLVAALVVAYSKFEWFRNGINSVFSFIADLVKPIIMDFVEFFKTKIAEMQAWWAANGAMITQAFQNVFNFLRAIVMAVLPFVMAFVQGFIEGVKDIISGGLKVIQNLITFFAALFTGNWSQMWESLKGMVMGALQLIWGLFQAGLLGRVFGIIKGFVGSAGGAISGFVSKIVGFFTGMVSKVKGFFTDMVDTVLLKAMYGFDRIKSAIMTPIQAAVDFVKGQVDKIAGFFRGLNISFPRIKLPHFRLTGEFSLKPPSVPKLGVDWYKKGGVFGGPSIIGVGEEPGVSEAVIPLKKSVLEQIGEGIAAASGGGGVATAAAGPVTLNVQLEGRTIARAIIDDIDELLGRKTKRK